jgi:hypothetical protein
MTIVMSAPEKIGKYRITGVIGEGVSGVVYKAFDPALKRVVAVKSLQRGLPQDAHAARAFAARLREQAQTVARLAHPGIAAIHEIDESGGRAFVAMEHVAGLNLAQWLSATPLPALTVLLQVMDQLLDALDCAHLAGIRHGDIKPTNLIVTSAGLVKITDFGLARAESRAGVLAGIAPEYLSGRPLDHRVDVYAAGVVLYKMLVGRDPFAKSFDNAFSLGGVLRAPSTFGEAHRPPSFDGVVAKAMAHDPSQRYATAAEFRDALRDATQVRLPVHGTGVVTLGSDAPANSARAPVAVLGEAPNAPVERTQPTRSPPSGDAAGKVPMLTIAIPDSVLAMPSYDPWAAGGAGGPPLSPGDRPESALASDTIPGDDGYAALRGQVDRDRRASVVYAATAASAALSAAADAAAEADAIARSRRRPVPADMPILPLLPEAGVPRPASGIVVTDSVLPPGARQQRSLPHGDSERRPTDLELPLLELPRVAEGEGIPAEALRRVLRVLSTHFGEIAGDVLKQAAGRANTIPELHTLLLDQASTSIDKKKMAKQLRAVAKLPL